MKKRRGPSQGLSKVPKHRSGVAFAGGLIATAALVLTLGACAKTEDSAPKAAAPPALGEVAKTLGNITIHPDTSCTGSPAGQPLMQPRNIWPGDGNVVNTALTVRKEGHCVPFWYSQDAQGNTVSNPRWEWAAMSLRSYGAPVDGNNPDDPNMTFSIPGPTYRINKAYLQDNTQPPGPNNPEVKGGTRFQLRLTNDLDNNTYPYHDCDPAVVFEPPPPGSTGGQEFTETSPECFHGADVTNIHYHGTHVSPQPHQDFVLLQLFSGKQVDPPPPPVSDYVAIGSYQTDINPFPWNQAPGTHWYHPHKHGSTALQVLNGLSGSLLIQGPFDEFLYEYYDVDWLNEERLEAFEKLMVVQQVWPDLNFYKKPHPNYPPLALVNGQASPRVEMKPGEVQRWRFIGATMQSAAQLQLSFPPSFEVKQIAQDGVQFAPENYDRQPLYPKGDDGNGFLLAPGNRADFLVKAPDTIDAKQSFFVTQKVVGHLPDDVKELVATRASQIVGAAKSLAATAAAPTNPPLFIIDIEPGGAPMTLPSVSEWPAMPYYLRDIEDSEVVRTRTVPFSMTPPGGAPTTPGKQQNSFWIDNTQYDAECSNYNMQEGTAEDWEITNDSAPQHPFHIHINPFQVRQDASVTFDPPYPWQDTISLPAGAPGAPLGVLVRHRFEDYTGGYVIHCHFLGHEDRGMMLNIQTVCPQGSPDEWNYGMPVYSGAADDCSTPSSTPALPSCTGTF